MRKIEKRQIVKNVSSNWFSLGINVVVGFLLTPFILHRLGDTANGLWIMIGFVTGYYGLFDLGIRSSIVRYVSKFTATGDREELAKLINTSLFEGRTRRMLRVAVGESGHRLPYYFRMINSALFAWIYQALRHGRAIPSWVEFDKSE